MKYWWLSKYKNIKIIDIKKLKEEVNYYLTMPKDYIKSYNDIKETEIINLKEEDLLIELYIIVNSKRKTNNNLLEIINQLILIPDTNLPISDYSVKEILMEIKTLKSNKATSNKIEENNISACYNCLNIFYTDKIKYLNKNNLCLCPYCKSSHLYFDNDLIPMNYSFLLLSKLFYNKTSLGSSFKNLQKLLKESLNISKYNIKTDYTFNNKYKNSDERITNELIRNDLNEAYINNYYKISFNINEENISFIFLITIMEFLGTNPYIKEIYINSSNEKVIEEFITTSKVIINFK